MVQPSHLQEALREAARALQDGGWLIWQLDLDAADVLGDQLWVPFRDVLEAEEPQADRVRARLEAVPAACAAALRVPGIEDRFAELLRVVPHALADTEQDEAVRLLGQFGMVVHAVCNGPEAHF